MTALSNVVMVGCVSTVRVLVKKTAEPPAVYSSVLDSILLKPGTSGNSAMKVDGVSWLLYSVMI